LIAYGGGREDFGAIEHSQKIFIEDPQLRTRDHQREYQSYSGLFNTCAVLLDQQRREFQFIHVVEYDHLPLVEDLNQRQIDRLAAEHADVLGFRVQRVDGTSYPHFLYHQSNPAFSRFWREISKRREPDVVLSMFGSGSFWTRDAFLAVASVKQPFPMYMEIYLPSLAHHLGFRIRDFGEQNTFVHHLGDLGDRVESARRAGAWTLHPVKKLWDQTRE
jgi:hypothetical protein